MYITIAVAITALAASAGALFVTVKTANSVSLQVADAADSLDRLSDILKRRR